MQTLLLFGVIAVLGAPVSAASSDSAKGRAYQGPAALSPKLVATAIGPRTIAVRRLSDHGPVTSLESDGTITLLALSPAESSIAAATRDGKVLVWSLPDGRPLAAIAAHDDEITALAYSPSGSQLASASRDTTVRTWDPTTGAPLRLLKGHNAPVLAVSYSQQEDRLASAGEDRTIRVWDPANGSRLKVIRTGVLDNPAVVAFSPTGALLASSGGTTRIRLWRTVDGMLAKTFHASSPAASLVFSASGEVVAAAQRDGRVSVWKVQDAALVDLHEVPADKAAAVRFTDADARVAVAGAGGSLTAFNAPLPPERLVATAPKDIPAAPDELKNLPGYRTPRRNAYAVILGIEQYRDLVKADYASSDAAIMKDYFRYALGIPPENIATLLDDRASLSDLKSYFESWLKQNMQKDAEVFVYYSGHGTPDPETGNSYLVPYDATPESIRERGYSLNAVYEILATLPMKRAVVMLDACFSGAGGPRTVIAKGARPIVPTVENPLLASGKISVLAASTGAQISGTLDDKRHGLFTFFLAKGLQGAADLNKDKAITLSELYEYLRPEVIVRAREKNREQQPTMLPGQPDKAWANEPLAVLE